MQLQGQLWIFLKFPKMFFKIFCKRYSVKSISNSVILFSKAARSEKVRQLTISCVMNNFPLIFCSKISHITGTKNTYIVHDALFWQLLSHLSLVECQYGTLRRESREFLYNMKTDIMFTNNVFGAWQDRNAFFHPPILSKNEKYTLV